MVLKNPKEYEVGKTIVYFVRHGERESQSIENSRIPGPGLTEKGKIEAKYIANSFKKIGKEVDIIYTSSMLRAQQTAEYISKAIHKKIHVCDELSEFNKFVWRGKIYHPKFWKHYSKYLRAQKCFDEILKKQKGKVIVIVAHGNIMKGLIGKKMKVDFKHRGMLGYNNCYVSKLQFSGLKFDYMQYYNSKEII